MSASVTSALSNKKFERGGFQKEIQSAKNTVSAKSQVARFCFSQDVAERGELYNRNFTSAPH